MAGLGQNDADDLERTSCRPTDLSNSTELASVKVVIRIRKHWSVLSAVAVMLILLGASAYVFVTLPPRTLAMATGAEGGASHELGKRYRDVLARSGITLKLVPTAGSEENLAKLRDLKSGVGAAFVQGGTTSSQASPNLESLGTVYYEPLWFFHRSELGLTDDLRTMQGRRLSIGPEGSGTRALAHELVKRTRLDGIVGEFLGYSPQLAAEKLIAGDIDAAFIVTGWDSSAVQQLLKTEGIELRGFARADAFIAHYPFLNKLVLPAGVVDLLTNRPPKDVALLAPKASLVVRADLHAALQYLLLTAAVQIHSQPEIFSRAGQFPAAESIDLPLSEEAQRFYKSGRPFFQNHLPFWLATLIERVLVIFLPLAVLIYPVIRFLPNAYNAFLQARIARLYAEMRALENEIGSSIQDSQAANIHDKLNALEKRASGLSLPAKLASSVYTARLHIGLVRDQLVKSQKHAIATDENRIQR